MRALLLASLTALGLAASGASLALELNQANEAELDSLRGMGPALNRRVRQAREQQAFTNWSDFLRRVSGVGASKARLFSDQGLTIEGQPFTP
ncbi:MAG: hypothetical protein RLZZ24_456 [Pseudomonadota bacterium]|jgi:competence protein ComEA